MAARRAAAVACGLVAILAAFLPTRSPAAALFDDPAELALVVDLPIVQLVRAKRRNDVFPATLHFKAADGSQVSLAAKVRARGHKRREACDFPPLRVEVDRAQAAGTPFAGQGALKLVTQCRPDRRYAEYVRLEQRIYQAWQLLSPYAFRTRTVAATFVDVDRAAQTIRGPAFFIEDIDDVAKRTALRKAKVPALEPAQLDGDETVLVELFDFMIGNTDFSVHRAMDGEDDCCHNGRVLGPVGDTQRYVIVPYDFDQAGLINAEYAAVSPVVGVKHVRTRIYRGVCTRNAFVPAAIAKMQQARPQIEALFSDAALAGWAADRASRYVKDFYAILDDPAETKAKIYGFCRSDPDPWSPPASPSGSSSAAKGDAASRGRLP